MVLVVTTYSLDSSIETPYQSLCNQTTNPKTIQKVQTHQPYQPQPPKPKLYQTHKRPWPQTNQHTNPNAHRSHHIEQTPIQNSMKQLTQMPSLPICWQGCKPPTPMLEIHNSQTSPYTPTQPQRILNKTPTTHSISNMTHLTTSTKQASSKPPTEISVQS